MSYRRRAGGGRRDIAEADIVADLRKLGVRCWFIGGTGNPDVLTYYGESYLPLEIKTEDGQLTANQLEVPWPVVNSFDAAWAAILKAR